MEMEVVMEDQMRTHTELDHRTTILLSPRIHERLTRLASRKRTSMGALIRAAVEAQYGLADADDRHEALRELAAMGLPVGSPSQMKAGSVEDPKDLP